METSESIKADIIPYRISIRVMITLIILALLSVLFTQIYLGSLTVAIALIIAAIKSSLVLLFFMHLKFENRMFSLMVIGVVLLLGIVITLTMLDYLFR